MKYVRCGVGCSWVAEGLPSMQKAPGYAVTFLWKTFLIFCDNFLKKLSALLGAESLKPNVELY